MENIRGGMLKVLLNTEPVAVIVPEDTRADCRGIRAVADLSGREAMPRWGRADIPRAIRQIGRLAPENLENCK